MNETSPRRGPASLASTILGVLYVAIAVPAVAIGIFLYQSLGHSLEHASAGSPERAAGGVLLTFVGWAAGGLAIVAAMGLAVGITIVAMSIALRRGVESMRIPLVVLFAIAALAKVAGVLALHAASATVGYGVWALLDTLVAVGLVREGNTPSRP